MQIKINPKEFALDAFVRYFKNPSLCGVEDGFCCYLTTDGKRCVAGQYILPVLDDRKASIDTIICMKHGQENVFRPEFVNILTDKQWDKLQQLHDYIARYPMDRIGTLEEKVNQTGLFTLDELIAYAAD